MAKRRSQVSGLARRWAITMTVVVLSIVTVGCFPVVDQELTGDYLVIAADVEAQATLAKRDVGSQSISTVVEAMVFEYGWNDSFIIAKQHPLGDNFSKVDTSVTNWFIVQVDTDTINGPMSETEFNQLFTQLKIPDEVTFSNSLPVEG